MHAGTRVQPPETCFCGKTGNDLGIQLRSSDQLPKQAAFTETVFPRSAKGRDWEEGKSLFAGPHLPLSPYPKRDARVRGLPRLTREQFRFTEPSIVLCAKRG